MPIIMLLADDSDIVRRTIRRVLDIQPEVELIGEVTDFTQIIQTINDLKPQVIVLRMPKARMSKPAHQFRQT